MNDRLGAAPERLDRSKFSLVFADDFTGDGLDNGRWVPHYLPHWTTEERSAARFVLADRGLRLLIDADQPAWRPEDGGMRVSNIQTGSFSGPRDSTVGQHRHRDDLLVRSPQPTRRLWTPSSGLAEATMCATRSSTCMLAVWLVGFEETSPEDSGEICIAELFGSKSGSNRSTVRLGVKAHHDPRLRTDMVDLVLELDTTTEHVYAAEWNSRHVHFYIDERHVHTVEQGLTYPLQLMVDLFEFPTDDRREEVDYPKSAEVRGVRGYEWA
jgi:hypothetical protein